MEEPRSSIILGDITALDVDVVVNAANRRLAGGGGVDGAIHRAAGPRLREHCKSLGGCPTGGAVLSPGFNLRARYIVHAVGPVWHGGDGRERELLASCYRKSMMLADSVGAQTIAFPAISCGAYGFPVELAAEIAITEVDTYLQRAESVSRALHVCFGPEVFETFTQVGKELSKRRPG